MTKEQKKCCDVVERMARTLGKCVQIIITPESVEIADTSWPGSCAEDTLSKSLEEAMKVE